MRVRGKRMRFVFRLALTLDSSRRATAAAATTEAGTSETLRTLQIKKLSPNGASQTHFNFSYLLGCTSPPQSPRHASLDAAKTSK